MSHSAQDGSTPMIRFLRDIYFTAFTIFYRLGISSTPSWDKGRGAAGIAIIQAIVLMSVEGWIEMLGGTRLPHLPKWMIFIAGLALCVANYYVLVTCGHGVEFEREFSHLKKSRKVLLVTSCVAIMLAAIVFFIYSAIVHRHFIGKP